MTTAEYLSQISRFEDMIERKQNEIIKLDNLAHGIKSPSYDPDKVQTSLSGDKMSNIVVKLLENQEELQDMIENYLDKRNHIIAQIDKIPNRISYVVLTDRYVEKNPTHVIASKINYSERWVRKAHARALREFETLYGDEYLDLPTIYSEIVP